MGRREIFLRKWNGMKWEGDENAGNNRGGKNVDEKSEV